MMLRAFSVGRRSLTGLSMVLAAGGATPASAQLYWYSPSFAGEPARAGETGLGVSLPGATPAEETANLIWAMRAGLNVAALQCQFSPTLMTVSNYNRILGQHAKELNAAYAIVTKYFKRTVKGVRPSQMALDQYTTRTYNGFSTLHAQFGFCQTASRIGYEALRHPAGQFGVMVTERIREFRNSLIPFEDPVYPKGKIAIRTEPLPPLDDKCWDKRMTLKDKCRGTLAFATAQR